MFKRFRLRYKILLGYLILLSLFLLVNGFIYFYVQSMKDSIVVIKEEIRIDEMIDDRIQIAVARIQKSIRAYMLEKNEISKKVWQDNSKLLQDTIKFLVKEQENSATLQKKIPMLKEISEKGIGLIEFTKQLMDFVDQGDTAKAIEKFKTGHGIQLGDELDKKVDAFSEMQSKRLEKTWEFYEEAIFSLTVALFSGIIVFIGLAITLLVSLVWEIRQTIAREVSDASTTSTQIEATVLQHERTANHQVSSLNEVTSTIEELALSAKEVAEQSSSASNLANKSSTMTEEGRNSVKQAMDAMESLTKKIESVASQILHLSEKTSLIGNIAELLKDLSAQINMLALNASVEAARAGEHGKGFAVVAAEVRKLSVESKKSAEQARSIVSGIQKATDTTIMKTEEATKSIKEVMKISGDVDALFDEIYQTASFVYSNTQQVVLNTKEQSKAINLVVDTMNSMNAGVRDTASGISQIKIGIQNLNNVMENLKRIV